MVVREDGKKDRKGEPDGRMEGWTEREGWMGGQERRLGREDKNKKEGWEWRTKREDGKGGREGRQEGRVEREEGKGGGNNLVTFSKL